MKNETSYSTGTEPKTDGASGVDPLPTTRV